MEVLNKRGLTVTAIITYERRCLLGLTEVRMSIFITFKHYAYAHTHNIYYEAPDVCAEYCHTLFTLMYILYG